jgi:hypothetical protein
MLAPISGFNEATGLHTSEVTVRYSVEVLEQIRRLAVEGLKAFSHGGVETGGVLYGTREAGRVTVLAYEETCCEHAAGPRFVLSAGDRAAFTSQMRPPEDFETVGWFRAHTRSGHELDANDRELFDEYFTTPGSVTLIVVPTTRGAASASFYARGTTGAICPETPHVFALGAVNPLRPSVETAAPVETGSGSPPVPPPAAPPEACQAPALVSPAHVAPALVPPPLVAPAVAVPAFAALPPPAARSRSWLWLPCLAIPVAILASIAYRSGPPPELGLHANTAAPGQVRIEWNRLSPAVLGAASGVLEIRDGDGVTRIPMDGGRLRTSSVVYAYRTGHVSVSISVAPNNGGGNAEDRVELVGLVPEPSPVAVSTPPNPAPGGAAEARAERSDSAWRLESEAEARPVAVKAPAVVPRPPLRTMPATPRPAGARESQPALLAPPAVELHAQPPAVVAGPLFLPPAAHAPAPPDRSLSVGVRSGRLIWTGVLRKRDVVEIEAGNATVGSLSGALPGVPVALRVMTAEFDRNGLVVYTTDRSRAGKPEAPSQANGWNPTSYRFDPERTREVAVLEAPNRTNNFTRLVLRNDGREYSVIVVEWTTQP